MIEKRKREELYNKFRQGAVPSGADFADLIRSQLNLLDDGIDISENPDDPIGLRAHGMKENLLDFSDQENRRRWTISGRCEDESKEGLNVKADENSKLYIERESGNLGLSTDQPTAKLHIIQTSATNALRIDDEGNDRTPLIVTSDGQVGIGLDSPGAKLHVSYNGIGDILRVDDTEDDTTPFIITDTGNVGMGYSDPKAKLTVNGGVSIGKDYNPGDKNLYVEGNVEIAGSFVLSGDSEIGGFVINAPITSMTEEVIIKDNLRIIPDPGGSGKPASDGSLSVAGDTTLGTYDKVPANQNVVTINGQIRSGGELGDEQYELVVNDILTLNRNTNSPQATIQGALEVNGDTNLGNSDPNTHNAIYLNGTVGSKFGEVIIKDKLNVTNNTVLKHGKINELILGSGVTVDNISNDPTLSGNNNRAIPTEQAVKEYVDNLLVGSITAFAVEEAPSGWLECDGQAVSRTTYARLYGKIGTGFGAGNGATTFNLPDLQNEFIRGWDHVRSFGSKQGSAFQDHRHGFSGTSTSSTSGSHSHLTRCGGSYRFKKGAFGKTTVMDYSDSGRSGSESHSHTFTPYGTVTYANSGNRDSNETRPRNMALMYCIKY
jgi:microcystin-dependent protein